MSNITNLTTIFCVVKGNFYGILQDVEIFGEKTPSEIVMHLFPGAPSFRVFLGTSKTSGHLEILKEKGSVKTFFYVIHKAMLNHCGMR
jgi:hypothetical protein